MRERMGGSQRSEGHGYLYIIIINTVCLLSFTRRLGMWQNLITNFNHSLAESGVPSRFLFSIADSRNFQLLPSPPPLLFSIDNPDHFLKSALSSFVLNRQKEPVTLEGCYLRSRFFAFPTFRPPLLPPPTLILSGSSRLFPSNPLRHPNSSLSFSPALHGYVPDTLFFLP
jgi:hypothetical protein